MSVYPFWGLSQNTSYIRNFINVGDVLWFCQDFQDGLKVIGMAEYTHCYDIHDEPLIPMNIIEIKQNWDLDMADNEIQIHYKNIYTLRQNIVIEKQLRFLHIQTNMVEIHINIMVDLSFMEIHYNSVIGVPTKHQKIYH